MDFASDLSALQDRHPETVLTVSNGSGVFEIRAAGTPCGCHTCSAEDQQVRTDSGLMSWWSGINSHFMIVCSECGNKRCPHATDHDLACTGSNDVGQPGSIYEGAPRPVDDETA